jgi:hypothetical protein
LHLNRPPLVAYRLARQAGELLRQRIRVLEEQVLQREQAIQILNEYIAILARLISQASASEE